MIMASFRGCWFDILLFSRNIRKNEFILFQPFQKVRSTESHLRWYFQKCITNCLVIPIQERFHWFSAAIFEESKVITVFDSLYKRKKVKVFSQLLQIAKMFTTAKKILFKKEEWILIQPQDIFKRPTEAIVVLLLSFTCISYWESENTGCLW